MDKALKLQKRMQDLQHLSLSYKWTIVYLVQIAKRESRYLFLIFSQDLIRVPFLCQKSYGNGKNEQNAEKDTKLYYEPSF